MSWCPPPRGRAAPPATNIEETRRQAVRQNDREVRETIVRVLAQRLKRSADANWSANDFDFTGPNTSFEDADFNAEVVSFDGASFESDASFGGAVFRARTASFDGATFGGNETSFDDVRFAGEYVSFRRAGFSGGATTFGPATFKCLRASFESPTEWKNVEFDWDNPSGGTQPAVPRCITPRPWPPYLVANDQDDGHDS